MSLDLTPVHRNLHTKVTFLGLEFEDLILVLALAALMNLLAHFVSGNAHVLGMPLNIFMEFVVPALAVPFLILFKYGSLCITPQMSCNASTSRRLRLCARPKRLASFLKFLQVCSVAISDSTATHSALGITSLYR